MKPAPFDYVAATSVEHALDVLADRAREVKVLAGGQSLLPVLNLRMGHPEVLVDVCRVAELQQLRVDDDQVLHVAAGVRQSTVLSDRRVSAGWPLLRAAVHQIGHPQIRSRGTLCGSIAHADPAAELPAASVALDATMVVRSRTGERTFAAQDFFLAPFTTVLEDGELLVEVRFPAPGADAGWAFEEFATRRGDFATAGAAVTLRRENGRAADVRVVLFGVAGTPVRIGAAEQALDGGPIEADAIAAAVDAIGSSIEPADDVHASAEFRRETAARMAARAIEKSWERTHA